MNPADPNYYDYDDEQPVDPKSLSARIAPLVLQLCETAASGEISPHDIQLGLEKRFGPVDYSVINVAIDRLADQGLLERDDEGMLTVIRRTGKTAAQGDREPTGYAQGHNPASRTWAKKFAAKTDKKKEKN